MGRARIESRTRVYRPMKIALRALIPIFVVAIVLVIYWQNRRTTPVLSSLEAAKELSHTEALRSATSEERRDGVQQKTGQSKRERWDEIIASARKQVPADIAVDEEFSSMMDQRIALFEYSRRVLESEGEETPKHLFAYFKAFPRKFKTFFQITHSEYIGDVLVLFSADDVSCECDYSNPWGTFYPGKTAVPEDTEISANKFKASEQWQKMLEARLIQYDFLLKNYKESGMLPIMLGGFLDGFKGLRKVIPEEVYYRKMLSVSVGAFWDMSDEIVDLQHELWILLHENLPLFVKILDEYSDDEIASIFYFMHDGMHPEDKCIKPSSCPYTTLSELSPKVAHNFERAHYQLSLWKTSPSCEFHNY